ncbi:RagB/SusD family nutrient uptake outer membrane protein [Mucilaginibacter sp. L3T2-6]|uniref:RagB/SusD family nutrient uptake outer membrane protein n=1 Tax=Mucilaginibacter sp. L3T2-6 TaxID=3062491 RepID=UPI002674F945|nr:RagB/SusD family nutrient uptake outer membrane protein [Mucilaginibacter sp. L3T2-6]MDO3641625.1 RagB/SusD family nutrient uptake outer membrane protein [Mucilaginibacter sp. L3T2-6]MDV6214119.1 RagB/SusD family nutrient uptake outer membrane protein [Mucilaginibacter sp. L3T2-6]
MKKYLKSAAGISILAALVVTQSCKKSFLDVTAKGTVASAQFWKTETDATSAVNAMYANLHEWTNIAFAPIAVESMGSDDVEKGSTPTDASFMNDFHFFTANSGEGQIADFWGGEYKTINFANQILDNVPGINMDANLKSRYLAEAKFIRAYAYFRLVRAFGDVPLRLHVPKTANEYNIPRTPKAQVWTAIETDLTDAASVLPQSYGAADVGHVTKGAALTLHAKAALYQKKWADVVNYTNQVMGLGYSLFPDYEQMFRTNHKNNQESIFEIQNMLIPNNPGASNSQYSQVQGVRGSTGGGWGFNVPSADLAAAYETGDPRRDATIIFRGETTPEGDAIPADGDNPMYNQKSYVPFSLYVSGFNEGCQQNKIVLRYADVLLMNAEANNELGNTAAALIPLEQVRARARAGNNAILPKVVSTDQATVRAAIYHERRVEFAMEFDRYFDVIRQGRGAEVFGSRGWKANKNEVWPVPQNEIDLSAGTLTQNPGY